MLLTETNIIHYLMGKGLAGAAAFIQGRFSCRGSEGRHRHFCINREFEGTKLFIKQAPLYNPGKTDTMMREGFFYQLATGQPFRQLQPYLPEVRLVDNKNAVIVFTYYSGSVSLYDWLLRTENNDLIQDVANELAAALYSLHTVGLDQTDPARDLHFFSDTEPWILSLGRWKGGTGITVNSGAEQQGIDLIFSIPGFKELIGEAALLWDRSAIIHGDCKLNNFLLDRQSGRPVIKWIDWEIVTAGDPLWDMATVFQSALTAWVLGQDPLYLQGAAVSKAHTNFMQEFISLSWGKYALLNGWDQEAGRLQLEKCIRFTALRLLHSCFETTPGVKNLLPYSARLLQVAHNILLDPASARSGLLGIS